MTVLKLLAYSLFGYVLYELYLGITEGVEAKAKELQSASEPAGDAPKSAGPKSARGSRSVSVQGVGGSRTKRTVGRGVI